MKTDQATQTPAPTDPLNARVDDLHRKVDLLLTEIRRRQNEIEFLQGTIIAIEKFHSQQEKIFSFEYGNKQIKMYLPEGSFDFIQREIIRNGTFYQNKHLYYLTGSGVLKPGQSILDIGANIGNHSVYFGAVAGARKVVAFEPSPRIGELFRVNMALNSLDCVRLERCALGASTGHIRLEQHNPFNCGGSTAVMSTDGSIPIRRLDDVIDEPVDFVKIDVEGMLMNVITGAERLLTRHRPSLFVEAMPGERAALDFCREKFKYRLVRSFGTDHLLTPL